MSPSTVFATPPVSFVTETENEEGEAESSRTTAVGIHSGEGVKGEGRGVWVWSGEEGEKRAIALEQPVQSLHALNGGWPLLAVGAAASLHLINEDGSVKVLQKPRGKARILAAGVEGNRVVLADEHGRVYAFSLDHDGGRAELAADVTLGKEPLSLLAASVGGGVLTAIDSNNRVHVRKITDLEAGGGSIPLAHPCTPAAIVSLGMAGRPIAALAVPHPFPSVALVSPLPDLPAALATQAISSGTTQITHLAVLSQAPGTYTLGTVLSHPGSDGSGRSVIHVLDVSVPESGIGLSSLIGSAEATAEVFSQRTQPHGAVDKMLEGLRTSLAANTPEKAEKSFQYWLDEEDKKATAHAHGSGKRQATIPESVVRRVVSAVFDAALETKGKSKGPYAGRIISTLAERRLLSDDMYAGGLVLGALLPVGDWRNISRLVRSSPALPSKATVGLIQHALEGKSGPSLSQVLEDILSGPEPDPAYRAELRALSPTDALKVLEQYLAWAEAHTSRGDGLESWPERQSAKDLPPLAALVQHASMLLDAQLGNLVTLPTAQAVIERFKAAIEPALAAQNDYRRLKAPVEATLRAGRERADARRKDESEEQVGKWRVEDFVF